MSSCVRSNACRIRSRAGKLRDRAAAPALVALLAIGLAACAGGPPPPPEGGVRDVQGNVLSSTAMPRASLVVDDAFSYVGSQTITLSDIARAEQHFFAALGRMGTVERLLWVQYEGFLDGVNQTYDYSRYPTVAAGDLVVHHDPAFYPTSDLDEPRDSDGARAKRFLQTVGYRLEDEVLRWRFVWVSGPARNEMLIIYMEGLASLDLTVEELEDEERWAEVQTEALDRALAAFQLNVR